jgi:hypothetical protein
MFSKRLDLRDVLEHVLDALPQTIFTDVPERLAPSSRRARVEFSQAPHRAIERGGTLTIHRPHTGFTTSSSGAKKGLCVVDGLTFGIVGIIGLLDFGIVTGLTT